MGSTRDIKPMKTATREACDIVGSFAPAGTGAVTDARGDGFSVARTGVGTFTITFDKVWPELESATATVQLNASANTFAQVGAVNLSSKTAVIRTITAGSDADIAANANNRVNFRFCFKNTSVS